MWHSGAGFRDGHRQAGQDIFHCMIVVEGRREGNSSGRLCFLVHFKTVGRKHMDSVTSYDMTTCVHLDQTGMQN